MLQVRNKTVQITKINLFPILKIVINNLTLQFNDNKFTKPLPILHNHNPHIHLFFINYTYTHLPFSYSRQNFLFQLRCAQFFAYAARHTLMKFGVKTGGQPFRVQIMYMRDMLVNVTSSADFQKSLTSQKFGVYRFCMTNEAQIIYSLTFDFVSGVQAKDYASHSENGDYLSAMENQARIAQLFIDQIKQENKEGLQMVSERNLISANRYSTEYLLTFIFIGIILALSYTQFNIIKNHMLNRKYI